MTYDKWHKKDSSIFRYSQKIPTSDFFLVSGDNIFLKKRRSRSHGKTVTSYKLFILIVGPSDFMFSKAAIACVQTTSAGIISLIGHDKKYEPYLQEEK